MQRKTLRKTVNGCIQRTIDCVTIWTQRHQQNNRHKDDFEVENDGAVFLRRDNAYIAIDIYILVYYKYIYAKTIVWLHIT